ncbi:hypothetical protein ACXYTP_21495 [Tsukamurella ocularis]
MVEHFAVTDAARRALDAWQRERPEVAAVVLSHVTVVPYLTSSTDLRAVASRTEHALGDVVKREVDRVTSIRDWNPRFAMTHVLHFALEQIGEPFTYQRFREFVRDDPQGRAMLTEPSVEAVTEAAVQHGDKLARDAMRWRIGNSYYSFLRELVTVVRLREQGLDLRVHPLADALFRADAWIGNTVVSLYIGNVAFRDGRAGRKPQPSQLLGDGFRYVAVNLPTQHTFGRVHVPSDDGIKDAAEQIRAAERG